jgi:hypothetical protein
MMIMMIVMDDDGDVDNDVDNDEDPPQIFIPSSLSLSLPPHLPL